MEKIQAGVEHSAQTASRMVPAQDQRQLLSQVVGNFSRDQLVWSSGYLAGLAEQAIEEAAGQMDHTPAPVLSVVPAASDRLTILYGSQTGNGKSLATALQREMQDRSLSARAVNMSDFKPRDIAKERFVAIVVSTHGEGDAPDDAELLLEYLQNKRAPRLDELRYFVLALGDSSYADYCQTGRDFDQQLCKLGAKRIGERVECDLDYQADAAAWQSLVIEQSQSLFEVTPTAHSESAQVTATSVATENWGADKPYMAEVIESQRITGRDSDKVVYHLELAVDPDQIGFKPGDALGLVTTNPPQLVTELLEILNVSATQEVSINDGVIAVSEALSERLEITALSGAFLERYAGLATNSDLDALLADKSRRAQLLKDHQVIDVMHRWPLTEAGSKPQQFIDCLRPLAPRVYSIASSPAATPDEIHLTIAEVDYEAHGRRHLGAASTAITQRIAVGDSVGIFVEPNDRFRLPSDDSVDVLMIGPGTGVAPFRSFVAEREARAASGRSWLFFGERSFDESFLYQTEWQAALRDGSLTRLDLAFSRDQAEKIYVQHRLLENGKEVYDWIAGGAAIYVCGDLTQMGADVHAALVEILAKHGGQSTEDAAAMLQQLKRDGRYQRDLY